MIRYWAAAAYCTAAFLLAPAADACRLALALALDVSGSVDDAEYRLQLDGVADALSDPQVQQNLFSLPDAPVSLAVYEWSSTDFQRLILGWRPIPDRAALAEVISTIRSTRRVTAPESTAIGAAMRYGAARLSEVPDCWQHKLDISGDGKNNDWPQPRVVKRRGEVAGITVNALVIGAERLRSTDERQAAINELSAYFHAEVIQGPNSFVETALRYEDYAAAMTRKLLRELEVPVFGSVGGLSRCSGSVRSSSAPPGEALC